jgi:tetratricopeptide (TPR) repeat protein
MPRKAVLSILFLLSSVALPSFCQQSSANQSQIAFHARMAQQYLREQKPDLAIPELEKLIALDPDNVDARGNLGVLLFFRGDLKEAVPQLRAAIRLRHDLWRIQALLGLAEAKSGDREAGRTDLETSFPHLTEEKVQAEVGQALINDYTSTGDLEKAATVASALLASRPTDVPALYLAYRLYSDLAAKAMLTLALAGPASAQMHQVMARELARHGDEAASIANYREAIKIDSRLLGIHSELGDQLYYSSDDTLHPEAESEFKTALEINPADEHAELMLGMIAAKRGDINTAYTDYSRALELDPNDGDACTEAGKVLFTMNQREKAQQMFERAVQIDPTNSIAHYRLGTLYRQLGKPDEAKEQIAEYLKYKQMKDKLEKVFHDMRVLSGQHAADDQDEKQ